MVVDDGGAAGRAVIAEFSGPLLVMVALPAVLVLRNSRAALLVMAALPAVLVS